MIIVAQFNSEVCKERHKSIDDRFDRNEDRLKSLESIFKIIQELTITISDNVNETKHLREDINRIIPRVEALEQKPAKRYDRIVEYIIFAIIGAILGLVFAVIGIK